MDIQLANSLDIINPFTQDQVKEGLQRWPANLRICCERAAVFKRLQKSVLDSSLEVKSLTFKTLNKIGTLVTNLEPLLRTSTEIEKEGYSQVCFTGTPWKSLNLIPFALLILSIYKSYIVPAFGIILPLLSWILPYILIKAFYNIPITFSEYSSILWRMWNGMPMPKSPQDLLNPPPMPSQDTITRLKTLVQNGWTLFTVGQAMWQPISQARHFIRLDADSQKLGESVLSVKEAGKWLWDSWSSYLPRWFEGWIDLCPSDDRQAFAFAFDTHFWLPHTFRALGRLEVLLRLADRDDVVHAEFISSEKPLLALKGFGDPAIPFEKRVTSNLGLGHRQASHSILTGPNRGGKSSFLRGILTNVSLAHTFGACFSEKAQMSYFSWIANGLGLADLPGEQSMFEREVGFGSGVLKKDSVKGHGLVLYDELFHSTNPPDAKRTSELFCDKLWKKTNCLSVISTHVYSLARNAPAENVKQLCVAAWRTPEGKYRFSYTVQKGICELSSVDLLLKQFGLLA